MQKEDIVPILTYFTNHETYSGYHRGFWKGLCKHKTFSEAYQAWIDDQHISRISFTRVLTDCEEDMPPLEGEEWLNTYIYEVLIKHHYDTHFGARFGSFNCACIEAEAGDVFWQRVKPGGAIVEVLTDDQFEEKYK
jgi:hypothetical protein